MNVTEKLGKDLTEGEWVSVEKKPEYEGDYLCFVEITQECEAVWERQQVISFKFFPNEVNNENPYGTRRFDCDKNTKVIKYQILPSPPINKSLNQ